MQTFVHGIGDLAMKGSLLIGDLSSNAIGSLDKVIFIAIIKSLRFLKDLNDASVS